jgi:hypothetical protein
LIHDLTNLCYLHLQQASVLHESPCNELIQYIITHVNTNLLGSTATSVHKGKLKHFMHAWKLTVTKQPQQMFRNTNPSSITPHDSTVASWHFSTSIFTFCHQDTLCSTVILKQRNKRWMKW